MNEGENAQLTGISKANSLEEIADLGIHTAWMTTGIRLEK
jgi:hypothetical protein